VIALAVPAFASDTKDIDAFVKHLRSQGIGTLDEQQQCARDNGECYPCGRTARAAISSEIAPPGPSQATKLQDKILTARTVGKPVVVAYRDGKDLHEALLRQGWVVAYPQYLPRSLKKSYLSVQTEAKAAKRGIWKGRFILPNRWRKGGRLTCER
jgi:endonuclease YncB( thermonuclease family)